jgi:hypothetical protein
MKEKRILVLLRTRSRRGRRSVRILRKIPSSRRYWKPSQRIKTAHTQHRPATTTPGRQPLPQHQAQQFQVQPLTPHRPATTTPGRQPLPQQPEQFQVQPLTPHRPATTTPGRQPLPQQPEQFQVQPLTPHSPATTTPGRQPLPQQQTRQFQVQALYPTQASHSNSR